MNGKQQELLIGGGVLLAVVGAIAFAGRSTASGATFSSANPQSVAAVQNGIAGEIASANAAAVQRADIASKTILGLAQLQQADLAAQYAVKQTKIVTDAQTAQVGLQSNAAIAIGNAQADAQIKSAQINGDVQKTVANNETTQAQAQAGAQKTVGIANAVASVFNTIITVFHHL